MTAVSVRVPTALRQYSAGEAKLQVELPDGADVAALFDRLAQLHPALERRLRDEQRQLRPHVNVFVGEANARDLDGTATVLRDGQEITVLPAVSGG